MSFEQTFTDSYGDKFTVEGNAYTGWVEFTATEGDDTASVEFKSDEAAKIALAVLEASMPSGIVTPAIAALREQVALSEPKGEVTVEVTEEVVEETTEGMDDEGINLIEAALTSLRNNLTAFEMFGRSFASCTPLEKKLVEFGIILTDELAAKK